MENRSGAFGPFWRWDLASPKLHSELGIPNLATMDSLRAKMPEMAMWPQDAEWGPHDVCLRGAGNPMTGSVEVVNHSGANARGLTGPTPVHFIRFRLMRGAGEEPGPHPASAL